MIHFLYRVQLTSKPDLAHSMFFNRGMQFKTRLGWDVTVNASGQVLLSAIAVAVLVTFWTKAPTWASLSRC